MSSPADGYFNQAAMIAERAAALPSAPDHDVSRQIALIGEDIARMREKIDDTSRDPATVGQVVRYVDGKLAEIRALISACRS
jgi:hypothetical protein